MTDSTSTSNISSSCGAADTSAAETSAASSVTTNKITNSTTSLTSDATASSTASATSEERSAVDVESELAFQSTHEQILVLTQLAKQLEYYFSFQNLANDTYLQTLRGLNDGCVPVSILANFSNVKLLLPVADDDVRIHAILQAATEYSELLSIVSIDTSTGTVATDETPSSAKTILSVGPVGKEPLRLSSTATTRPVPTRPEVAETTVAAANTNNTASTTSSSSVAPSTLTLCTTVILRDVPSDVTNDQVRELFEQLQDCPAVTSIHEDVGHCWFVKVDATSRQDMLRVVMQLRSSTLAGHPVHARLKASATAPVDAGVPVLQMQGKPGMLWTPPTGTLKKKKCRSRGKKKKFVNGVSTSRAVSVNKVVVNNINVNSQLPSLGQDDFPTLMDKQVEWETPLEEQEDTDVNDTDAVAAEEESESKSNKNLSDVASIASTTSSSSSSLGKQKTGTTMTLAGYAAALRNTIVNPVVHVDAPLKSATSEIAMRPAGKRKEEPSKPVVAVTVAVAPAVVPAVKPSPWGGSRSFVDVLRTSSA